MKPDMLYIKARETLLREAETTANRHTDKLGLTSDDSEYSGEWSKKFHRAMDQMWKKRGKKLMKEVQL